jgi:hypothetical protein
MTVKFGVAAGPWSTLAQTQPGGQSSYSPERNGVTFTVCFSAAVVTAQGVVLTVAYDVIDQDVRVVAIDKAGKVVSSPYNPPGFGSEHLRQATVIFPGVAATDIARFEFQIRPYEWAEFPNVSLRPGGK